MLGGSRTAGYNLLAKALVRSRALADSFGYRRTEIHIQSPIIGLQIQILSQTFIQIESISQ